MAQLTGSRVHKSDVPLIRATRKAREGPEKVCDECHRREREKAIFEDTKWAQAWGLQLLEHEAPQGRSGHVGHFWVVRDSLSSHACCARSLARAFTGRHQYSTEGRESHLRHGH